MVPTLKIIPMPYPAASALNWKQSCEMLESSRACGYLKKILSQKVSRRQKGGQRFFGEAYVATQIPHTHGYYGSFQWMTNRTFLSDGAFPKSSTQEFQQQYRAALHEHFAGQLEQLQENARTFEERTRIKPAAPDLWLIEPSGFHRFMEVKRPGDRVRDNQLAGLAVIANSLHAEAGLSVAIILLHPDFESRFAEFAEQTERMRDGSG